MHLDARRDTGEAASDVGDVGAMPAVADDEARDVGVNVLSTAVDRIGVRIQGSERPVLADEVEAADDVRVVVDSVPVRLVLVVRVRRIRAVRVVVGGGGSRTPKGGVGVVD